MVHMVNRRWWIAGLLFTATLLNYLDREVLSLVNPVLRKQLSLTATGYSHILTAFLLGYTLGQLLVGRIVDKMGARRSLLVAMIWWSTAGVLAATSRTAVQLGVLLFLMGLGEAAGWPSSVKAIQEWFSASQRALAVGFFNSGSSVGAVLAPLVVSTLVIHYSWRAAFSACGAIGFLWIVPWLVLYPPSSKYGATQGQNTTAEQPPMGHLLQDRRTYGVVFGRFFCDSIWYFYVFWLPDFFSRVRHFSLHQIGMTAWIPFVAAALGNLVGGFLSGRLLKRGHTAVRSRLLVMAGAALAMSSGIGIWFCKTPITSIALISFVVFAYSCWASNVLTLPSDLFSSGAVATIVGFSGMAGGLGGVLTTLLSGWLIDRFSYMIVFIVLAMLPLIGSACSLLSWKKSAPAVIVVI